MPTEDVLLEYAVLSDSDALMGLAKSLADHKHLFQVRRESIHAAEKRTRRKVA